MRPDEDLRFAGWSGSGKTRWWSSSCRVSSGGSSGVAGQHAHHRFEIDQPGKDSYRHRHAGCTEVLITSAARWALMHELRGDANCGCPRCWPGSRRATWSCRGVQAPRAAKLEIYRAELGKRCCTRGRAYRRARHGYAGAFAGGASPCSALTRMTRLPRLSRSGRCTRPLRLTGLGRA